VEVTRPQVVLVGLAMTANVKRPGDLAVPGRLRAWLLGFASDCHEQQPTHGTTSNTFCIDSGPCPANGFKCYLATIRTGVPEAPQTHISGF
jgi:hypothetical protein